MTVKPLRTPGIENHGLNNYELIIMTNELEQYTPHLINFNYNYQNKLHLPIK